MKVSVKKVALRAARHADRQKLGQRARLANSAAPSNHAQPFSTDGLAFEHNHPSNIDGNPQVLMMFDDSDPAVEFSGQSLPHGFHITSPAVA